MKTIAEMLASLYKKDTLVSYGVSIYPEHTSVDRNKAYLMEAKKHGFTKMFTCLLSVGDDTEQIIEEFRLINGFAQELGFEVVLDVSPLVFNKLGATPTNLSVFKQMNADVLRFDIGFGPQIDALLTHNTDGLIVEFNASTDASYAKNVLDHDANKNNLRMCHNFYPQLHTGLGTSYFMNSTQKLFESTENIAAFVSSGAEDTFGPWPVKEGLVTLEMHRHKAIDFQVRHLIATRMINSIYIGNAFASIEELSSFQHLNPNQVSIRIDETDGITALESEILYDNVHIIRGDFSDFVKRSLLSRFTYKSKDIPSNHSNSVLKRGDIVIINNDLPHYRGELQIVLQDTPNDGRYNVIAKIVGDEMIFIDLLLASENVQFLRSL